MATATSYQASIGGLLMTSGRGPHASGVSAPNSDQVFLHVRAGMTVIVEEGKVLRMADVIWVDGGARKPKVLTLFQVADVDTGLINWVNADLGIHIVSRV